MENTSAAVAGRLSASQRRVLMDLERTAFYGQNQRTFGALYRQGLIEFAPDHGHRTDANQYRRTELGRRVLRQLGSV